ncbi:hypothetical protein QCA50_001260 [Cerrena zonata]|uniref:Uncharacterized protein n=1 Tax=Cerrena zonata TaxID=2478898 RepID=A0AAW0GWB6_9APHY
MAPLAFDTYEHLILPRSSLAPIQQQWHNPTTILAVLSVIGGDIIHRATAQLGGNPYYIAPVTLSFGWTGFLLSFILALVGDGRATPRPDTNCTVVDVQTRATSPNKSWVLGRLVRDHTKHITTGLNITFYNTVPKKQGVPRVDWVYHAGFMVMLLQLLLSLIPGIVFNDWNILIVTIWGLLLGLAFGALPQWKKEKWSCSTQDGSSVVCFVRGKDVMVIISEGVGHLRLMDLATSEGAPLARGTLVISALLALLQMGRLLTVAGLHDHAWFSLAITCIGTVYNCIAAGARRDCSTTGIHLEPIGKRPGIFGQDPIEVLKMAEKQVQYVGIALLPVVFSGILPQECQEWRDRKLANYNKGSSTMSNKSQWSMSTLTLDVTSRDSEDSEKPLMSASK